MKKRDFEHFKKIAAVIYEDAQCLFANQKDRGASNLDACHLWHLRFTEPQKKELSQYLWFGCCGQKYAAIRMPYNYQGLPNTRMAEWMQKQYTNAGYVAYVSYCLD